jgi:hypothetical protein
MTTQLRLTLAEAGSLEHCPCGHNAWIQHHGVVEGSEPGCVHCDCTRTEYEASVAAVEAILTARLEEVERRVRNDWADYFESWSDRLGPDPLTVPLAIAALRAQGTPFGCARASHPTESEDA